MLSAIRVLVAAFLAGAAFVPAALAVPGPTQQASPSGGATLTIGSSKYGRILFDGSGRALYAFTRDRGGRSACTGPCAAKWPPYVVRGARRRWRRRPFVAPEHDAPGRREPAGRLRRTAAVLLHR